MIESSIDVGVVIPARDEAALLPACLAALDAAIKDARARCHVVLVLDACTDDSADVVEALRQRLGMRLTVLTSRAGSVGAARAAGAAVLLAEHPVDTLWLATTDADSEVCRHWLTRQLCHARSGVDLVAGTVEVRDWADWSGTVRRHYTDRYAHPLAAGGHGHVHGANLGLTARLYQELGGFTDLRTGEDVALVAAAQAMDAVVTWAIDMPVSTSGRATGRAPAGFAAALRELRTGEAAPETP